MITELLDQFQSIVKILEVRIGNTNGHLKMSVTTVVTNCDTRISFGCEKAAKEPSWMRLDVADKFAETPVC